jgi:LacI family transcriptional regulator
MSVTQKDIAQKLNISSALVSQALNGYQRVSEETRAKIFQVAAEMGYDTTTNQAARALAAHRHGQRAKTGIIAVMFPVVMDSSPRHMPFFMPFFDGMEREAHDLGMDVCLCWVRPGQLPRMIRECSVDGVVAIADYPQELLAIKKLQLPLVAYQDHCEGAHCVIPDDRKGTYLATRHLLEQGHRTIGFLGCAVDEHGIKTDDNLRLLGYLDALQEFNITPRSEQIETNLPFPQSTELSYCHGCGTCAACAGWRSLKNKNRKNSLTAVVCQNDTIAMGLIEHARQDGVEVPCQLSVVGFDDISQRYHFHPAITSVKFSRYEMGRCAVRLIHEHDDDFPCQRHVFPVTLVEHQTTIPLTNVRKEATVMAS